MIKKIFVLLLATLTISAYCMEKRNEGNSITFPKSLIAACKSANFKEAINIIKQNTWQRVLITFGIRPNNKTGIYDLFYTLFNPNYEQKQLTEEEEAKRNKQIKILIDTEDKNGRTFLMVACAKGIKELADKILEYDVHCNIQDNLGNTALIEAVKNYNLDMIHLLLAYNADPWISNNAGKYVWNIAEENGLIEVLNIFADQIKETNQVKEKSNEIITISDNEDESIEDTTTTTTFYGSDQNTESLNIAENNNFIDLNETSNDQEEVNLFFCHYCAYSNQDQEEMGLHIRGFHSGQEQENRISIDGTTASNTITTENEIIAQEPEVSIDEKENIASILASLDNDVNHSVQGAISLDAQPSQQDEEIVDEFFVLFHPHEIKESNSVETNLDENDTDDDVEFLIREATEEEIANAKSSTKRSHKRSGSRQKSTRPTKRIRAKITNKKFKCEVESCNKEYTTKNSLNRHVRDEHGQGHKCSNCDFKGKYSQVYNHQKKCGQTS